MLLTLPAHAGLMLGARETPVAADKHAASPAPPDFTPESRGVPSAEGAAEVPGFLVEARGTAPRTRSARPGHGWRGGAKARNCADHRAVRRLQVRQRPAQREANLSRATCRRTTCGHVLWGKRAQLRPAVGGGRDRYRWEMTGGRGPRCHRPPFCMWPPPRRRPIGTSRCSTRLPNSRIIATTARTISSWRRTFTPWPGQCSQCTAS